MTKRRAAPASPSSPQLSLFRLPEQSSDATPIPAAAELAPVAAAARPAVFEDLAHENGTVFWWASELARMLGYDDLRSFRKNAVAKAMTVCVQLGVSVPENFAFTSRSVDGADPGEDVKLSRFACYLVAMNGDVKKPQVAQAQAYFVTYARACEVYVAQAEGVERVATRAKITEGGKGLTRTATRAGVTSYAYFQNAGYLGLYNMSISEIRTKKNVPGLRSPLDFMGQRELAANLFRIEETEARLRAKGVRGQAPAENTAKQVGREIRAVMTKDGGVAPESLPPAEDIQNVRKGIKSTSRGFNKIDRTPKTKRFPGARKESTEE